MPLPLIDITDFQGAGELNRRLEMLRDSADASGNAAATVATIVDDVKQHGDDALVKYMRQFTDPAFNRDHILVLPEELKAAEQALSEELRDALAASIQRVRQYQQHILPKDADPMRLDGATLGLRFTPIQKVGLAVPGGTAAYPSSVIMLAVPALAAGIDPERIHVVSPPPTRKGEEDPPGDISPLVLGVCSMLGLTQVYRVGGAQAIAALAYGTQTIEPVDLIVGPGNIYTQLAKQRVLGRVGIDGFYGPSEIVTVADASADPQRVASDLIAQAEHDPGRCYLVAWDKPVIEHVNAAIAQQLGERGRRDAIEASFKDWSAAILAKDETQAVDVVNRFAAEHVNLAVAEPQAMLEKVTNAGEVFLGDATPVAAGDYTAGPSHTLPTGTTARYASGVSVYTFLKRTGTVQYKDGMPAEVIGQIATIADAEGLDGHAASARQRKQ